MPQAPCLPSRLLHRQRRNNRTLSTVPALTPPRFHTGQKVAFLDGPPDTFVIENIRNTLPHNTYQLSSITVPTTPFDDGWTPASDVTRHGPYARFHGDSTWYDVMGERGRSCVLTNGRGLVANEADSTFWHSRATVVDNGAADGSVQLLTDAAVERYWVQVEKRRLLRLEEARGFGGWWAESVLMALWG